MSKGEKKHICVMCMCVCVRVHVATTNKQTSEGFLLLQKIMPATLLIMISPGRKRGGSKDVCVCYVSCSERDREKKEQKKLSDVRRTFPYDAWFFLAYFIRPKMCIHSAKGDVDVSPHVQIAALHYLHTEYHGLTNNATATTTSRSSTSTPHLNDDWTITHNSQPNSHILYTQKHTHKTQQND